jgi:uncharacterized protein (TIGR00251 family)
MTTSEGFVRQHGDDLILSVHVLPRARNNEVLDVVEGQLRIRTTATPADGKANQAVIKLLAKYLHVAPSRIAIVRGKAHRNKQVLVSGPVDLPAAIAPGGAANGL